MPKSHTNKTTPFRGRSALALLAVVGLSLFVLAPAASANATVCPRGAGAGQCADPQGLAMNYESGRLYVADRDNNQINVFDAAGAFLKSFGTKGEGKGQFEGPTAVAVDNDPLSSSHGDVYVVDSGNHRIEKFDAEGSFILMFGGGVDKTAPGNICTAESGDTCGAGAEGEGEGEFHSNAFVGAGPGGTVYIVDSLGTDVSVKTRLQRFQPSGALFSPQDILHEGGPPTAVGVDAGGDFYVANETNGLENAAIRKYEPGNGTPIAEIDGRGQALAVDPVGDLFTTNNEQPPESGEDAIALREFIAEYEPDGTEVRSFAYGAFQRFTVHGLAPYPLPVLPAQLGGIYATESDLDSSKTKGSRVIHVDFPKPGPVLLPTSCNVKTGTLGNIKATLLAQVNPEGKASEVGFKYVDQHHFETEGGFASPETKSTSDVVVEPGDFVMHEVAVKVEHLAPETVYHCEAVAKNTDGEAAGEEGTFKTKEAFEFGPSWTSEVSEGGARLNAEINPLGIPVKGQFEYIDDAKFQLTGFAEASKAPAGEVDFGSVEQFVSKSGQLTNLSPGTLYHYRLRAKNAEFFPEGIVCPERKTSCPDHEHTFLTYQPEPKGNPDGRGYELVSPGHKNSADIGVENGTAGFSVKGSYRRIQAAAGSGEAMTYTSWTSFGEPEGAPATSQYIARRSPTGWVSENVSPFGIERLIPPYRGFSAGLGFGAVVASEPALTPEAVEGFENLYLRNNQTGTLQALTTDAPEIEADEELCQDYAGASEDGSHVFFAANAAYAGAPKGKGFSLYEWSAAKGLQPFGVLPNESLAAPSDGTAFGAAGGHCESGEKVSRDVISADGSRVFWTYVPKPGETQLLVRIGGKETVRLDKGLGNGVFQAASTDGSKAFFSDASKLLSAAGEGDLYLFELPGKTLKDLTPAELTPGSEAAGVRGVVGASDDGSYVYFVATGVLSGEEENGAKEKAKAGGNNLYLYHAGQVGFIATLAGEDQADWEPHPVNQAARVSPDGRHLAFLSIEAKALAGYDNTILSGSHCQVGLEGKLEGSALCPEAFLYSAEAKQLSCASCNPSASRPQGPSVLPGWSNPLEGPRYLSDNGSRLFFESFDPLLLRDENKKRDVYEFERSGAGSCSLSNPTFDLASDGCHFLISSGRSEDESYLRDASSNGRDVFFATRESILPGWDPNDNFDLYDFREGGGFPESPIPIPCEGEGCKPPTTTTPVFGALGSATFSGTGNLPPEVVKPAVKPKPKPFTRAQKLAKALKQCKKVKPRRKRAACDKSARKKYGKRK